MSSHIIPDDRKEFLLDNFVEYSFEQDENGEDLELNKDLFDSISRPEELYFLACNVNWDDGGLVPFLIVNSPLCTKSTALVIFWTSAPESYMQYGFGSKIYETAEHLEGEVNVEETNILRLLEVIVTRFNSNDFYDYDIEFDIDFWGYPLNVNQPKWSVGDGFYKSITGCRVI